MTEVIKDKTFEEQIQEDLVIDETSLRQELLDQPSHVFYWGSMWARASRARRKQKLDIEQLEAELSKDFREAMLKSEPGARVTEKMIREFLDGHPKYQKVQLQLIQASYMEDMFSVAKDAFKSKGQSLLELSKSEAEQKFYANEMKAMREEYETRESKKTRKGKKVEPPETIPLDVRIE